MLLSIAILIKLYYVFEIKRLTAKHSLDNALCVIILTYAGLA